MLEKIGRFKVLEELGRGGMAVVYKAYDPNINRPLVIKVLLEECCGDKEYHSRFLAEAKAAGLLSHPNIVTIYDISEVNDRPYIVMELLEGECKTNCCSSPSFRLRLASNSFNCRRE
jgi:serine/threonine-protein kinase